MLESVHTLVRKAETDFLNGNTKLGDYVNWSLHDTIERIDAYLNSKHISGDTDSLGRDKPFFNIVTAAVNIWYRATDIDRKDIKFVPTKNSSIVLCFVANIILQQWMREARFGVFLNQWGRSLARYGSSVPKFVEKNSKLTATVIPWNRLIADQIDYYSLPRIEKIYKSKSQLLKMATPGSSEYAGYDMNEVTKLFDAIVSRKTLKKNQKDNRNEFIELYEVSGEMDTRLLQSDPDQNIPNGKIRYSQQLHVISFVGKDGKKDEFDDFTLYKGREAKRTDLLTHLIEEDGRTLGIGAVEYLFDAQWMQNHTVKNMKDTLDLVSKTIFQTSDANYVNRNVLSAIEVGDILVHKENMPITRVGNDNASIAAFQNFGTMWQNMAQELTSTPDAIRGNTLPSSTPYALGNLLNQNASSLFEIMTENKGLAIEEMMREYVIPYIKKQLKHKKQIAAVLDEAGIQQIDAMYIPHEAVKRYNESSTNAVLAGAVPSPYQPDQAQRAVQSQLAPQGNTRFFAPDDIGEKMWHDIFSDFEWDNIIVEVTNEQEDKQAVLQTLNTVLQTISSNPSILQNPNAMAIFTAILNETGKISPIQLSAAATVPLPLPRASLKESIDYKDLATPPSDVQTQMLSKAGINVPQPVQQPTPGGGVGGGL